MVAVSLVQRKSPALTPSSLACLAKMPTVNVSSGCAHGCLYCYSRGYRNYPGEGKVEVYANLLEKLQQELPRKKKRPRAVYFSPSSDVFQPVPEVLDVTYSVFDYLLGMGVGVAFLTKGAIPEKHFKLLKAHADNVRAQVGLISLDRKIQQTFEPGASSVRQRLAQIRELTNAGIRTEVRLDPILPGLTDDIKTFRPLIEAIAWNGVTVMAASTLFLRPSVAGSLKRGIKDQDTFDRLMAPFVNAKRLAIHAEHSSVTALPKEWREQIFIRLKSVGQEYGVGLRTCSCKNPDLHTLGNCSISGEWNQPSPGMVQGLLFDRPERS